MITLNESGSASENVCENCYKLGQGRHIGTFGIAGESRGFYFICFECFAPRSEWRNREGMTYSTPIKEKL